MNWPDIKSVHDQALELQISWSLSYSESDQTWHFSLNGPEIEWTGRNRSWESAIELVNERLAQLRRYGK